MRETYRRYDYTNNHEQSLGDLFADLSARASLLVRQEIDLAKAEMSQKAAEAGKHVALIVLGVTLANAALLSLVAALVLGLSNFMEAWLAALLVGLGVGIIAALMAWSGIQALRSMEPLPEQTLETLREDKEWLTHQVS
jgi:uncharacterized membrane protein YqjE